MNIRTLFLVGLLGMVSVSKGLAQNGAYAAFEDIQQFFHVFEGGQLRQLEALKVRSYQVARNHVAFVNNQGQFKLYEKGYAKLLSENVPEFYKTTDHLLIFGVGGNLYVYEDKRASVIGNFVREFAAGDSIIAFNNMNNIFTVYYRGRSRSVEVFNVDGIKAGKNLVAYLDNLEQFQVYMYGQKYLIDANRPKEYHLGRNVMAYVDFYDRFKIFWKGEIIEADPFHPQSYQVGDNMVAYVNRNGKFMVFDDGVITEIESQPPSKFELTDGVIAYTLPSRQFKAYYKGETFDLESYVPDSWRIDNEVLVYPDYMGYLKGLYHGEPVKVSNRIQYGYDLWIDVAVANVGLGQPQFYYMGNYY